MPSSSIIAQKYCEHFSEPRCCNGRFHNHEHEQRSFILFNPICTFPALCVITRALNVYKSAAKSRQQMHFKLLSDNVRQKLQPDWSDWDRGERWETGSHPGFGLFMCDMLTARKMQNSRSLILLMVWQRETEACKDGDKLSLPAPSLTHGRAHTHTHTHTHGQAKIRMSHLLLVHANKPSVI